MGIEEEYSIPDVPWNGLFPDIPLQEKHYCSSDKPRRIEDKRQQVAGVSTDEELVSLLTYQHAYNASARYINTIDQMLQTLIERLG